MKRALAVIALPLMALLMIGATTDQGRKRGQQDVYFGFLLGSERVAAVAIDLGAPDRNGQRVLRAYVCDGFGPPEGMAIWFTGTLTTPPSAGHPVTFTSVAGHEQLVLHALNDRGVYGAFTDASGAVAQFVSYVAFDGAGIYQVTLDQALHYTGTSTDGAKLDAQASADGTTVGTIKPANGNAISFKVRSLALASPADLAAHGLSPDYTKFVANNQVPGEYVAVIAPGGSHWFGRSGAVRAGLPGAEIIGLDKKE
jgi:hypothetical protein